MIKWIEGTLDFTSQSSIASKLDTLHRAIEIATFQHAQELGFGDDVIRCQNWMWLVVKVATTIHRHVSFPHQVIIRTEAILGLHSGVLWHVQLYNRDHILFVEQVISWALADQQTLQLLSILNRIPILPTNRDNAKKLASTWFPKISPLVSFVPKFVYQVKPEDIDQNHHVHNTTFVAILFQEEQQFPMHYRLDYQDMMFLGEVVLIEESFQDKRIKRFVIFRENIPQQVCLASIEY